MDSCLSSIFRVSVALVLLSVSLLAVNACTHTVHSTGQIHAQRAQQAEEEGRLIEAIAHYRLHLADRLATKPKEENPYFYLLLIGDCYLTLDDVVQAEESYLAALEQEVSPGLVAERLRRLAGWYEERYEFERTLEILSRYRRLDPLLFDLELDRVHKAYVRYEIQQESSSPEEP